jgi:hypothetical protein
MCGNSSWTPASAGDTMRPGGKNDKNIHRGSRRSPRGILEAESHLPIVGRYASSVDGPRNPIGGMVGRLYRVQSTANYLAGPRAMPGDKHHRRHSVRNGRVISLVLRI